MGLLTKDSAMSVSDFIGFMPFCTVAGKAMPAMNFSRLLEAFIIAGVTMFGTVQTLSAEMKVLARASDDLRKEVTEIRLERAGRVKHIDAALEDLMRAKNDQEARLRMIEKRR